ncbi:MAG TPA: PEGA domain-containing protein, partial [Polyangiaceae bacterium]|nr:PEGA domain-containing protein [Polyangiaceae bacterium]
MTIQLRSRGRTLVAVALVFFATSPLSTSAATPDKKPAPASPGVPLASALGGNAKVEYEQGRLLYNDSDFAGALVKFKNAFDLSSEPRLLWNMAACEKALRHYARAYSLVNRYLKEGASVITAESRANAEETRRALRAFYSLVELRGAPSGARVFVDGQEVGNTPLTELALDLGSHTLRLEREGLEPFEAKVDVPGTTDATVHVAMKPRPNAARLTVTAGEGDSVAIDGKIKGVTRWEGALPAGEHEVNVTAPGKKPYETRFDLRPGTNRTVQITLE